MDIDQFVDLFRNSMTLVIIEQTIAAQGLVKMKKKHSHDLHTSIIASMEYCESFISGTSMQDPNLSCRERFSCVPLPSALSRQLHESWLRT